MALTALAFSSGVYAPGVIQDYRAQLGNAFASNDLGTKLIWPEPTTVQAAKQCRIGRFGQFPWLRKDQVKDAVWAVDTYQWARMAGLPHGAAKKYVKLSALGAKSGTADIYNNEVRTSTGKILYGTGIGSYQKDGKRFICYDSRADLVDQSRPAPARYFAIEFEGQVYHIIEPYACDNPQRHFEKVDPSLPAAPWVQPDPRAMRSERYVPGQDGLPPIIPNLPSENRIYYVPEPGSIFLVLIGLVAAYIVRRKRASKQKS